MEVYRSRLFTMSDILFLENWNCCSEEQENILSCHHVLIWWLKKSLKVKMGCDPTTGGPQVAEYTVAERVSGLKLSVLHSFQSSCWPVFPCVLRSECPDSKVVTVEYPCLRAGGKTATCFRWESPRHHTVRTTLQEGVALHAFFSLTASSVLFRPRTLAAVGAAARVCWQLQNQGPISESRFRENSEVMCCELRETQGFQFQKAGSP